MEKAYFEPIDSQRSNLFHTRGKVGGKTCLVMVDGGSQANLVSVDFCKRADIPTVPHSTPYRLQWLDDQGVKVEKQAKVLLTIGSYSDTILCDVVPMDACYVILRRPWAYDRDVVTYGKSNKCKVTLDNGKSYTLLPLSPDEILISQKKIQRLKLLQQQEELKADQECQEWSTRFEKEIQDLVMEDNLSDNLFDFVMSYPQIDIAVDDPPLPTIGESILIPQMVEDPVIEENSFVMPLGRVVHIDFICGDFFDKQADGPKVQDFLLQFKPSVFYF